VYAAAQARRVAGRDARPRGECIVISVRSIRLTSRFVHIQDELGFLGRMSNLLLGDDVDDAEVTGSSPLGDESGALLVRLAYR
jgi:hypothetical protein